MATRAGRSFTRRTTKPNLKTWCERNGDLGRRVLEEWDEELNRAFGKRGPEDVTRGSAYRAWWKCRECAHEWTAMVGPRTRKNRPTGCPGCAGKVATATNNLGVFCLDIHHGGRFDHLRGEWNHPTNKMEDYTPASHWIVPWRCATCAHEWSAKINNRTDLNNPTGCRKCRPGGKRKT